MNTHEELIEARDRIVTDYGALVPIREITTGVSAFPGGSGFLDGKPGQREVMFVLHNYDGTDNLRKPENYEDAFWSTLNIYMDAADIKRYGAFITNVYMGARPGNASGEMANLGGDGFVEQCLAFFDEQVRIVNPFLVVMCGEYTRDALKNWHSRPTVYVAHPSSNRDATKRSERAAKWVRAIKNALTNARLASNSVS